MSRFSMLEDIHALRLAQEATVEQLKHVTAALQEMTRGINAIALALSPPEEIVGIGIQVDSPTTH